MNLEILVYDNDFNKGADDFMGKINVNLRNFEFDKTHDVKLDLEGLDIKVKKILFLKLKLLIDGAGSLHMLITISGILVSNSLSENEMIRESQIETENYKDSIIREYVYFN